MVQRGSWSKSRILYTRRNGSFSSPYAMNSMDCFRCHSGRCFEKCSAPGSLIYKTLFFRCQQICVHEHSSVTEHTGKRTNRRIQYHHPVWLTAGPKVREPYMKFGGNQNSFTIVLIDPMNRSNSIRAYWAWTRKWQSKLVALNCE